MKNSLFLLLILMPLSYSVAGQKIGEIPYCKRDSIIDFAFTFLGCPYEFGATGPQTFDCSGFIQFIFKEFNVPVKRNSQLQNQEGEDVDLKDIQKGDLVFFFAGDYPERDIGHVGMAISSYQDHNFQFIHSSSSNDGVYVSEYKETMYRKSYAGAKRIVHCKLRQDISPTVVSASPGLLLQTATEVKEKDTSLLKQDKETSLSGAKIIYHRVKPHESLPEIARRYHVTVMQIKKWNVLKSSSLKRVKSLKIYLPVSYYSE